MLQQHSTPLPPFFLQTPSKISHNQMAKSLQKPHTHKVPSKLSDNQIPKSLKKNNRIHKVLLKNTLRQSKAKISQKEKHTHRVHSKLSNNQKQISTTTASADYLQINKTRRKEKEGKKKERRRS